MHDGGSAPCTLPPAQPCTSSPVILCWRPTWIVWVVGLPGQPQSAGELETETKPAGKMLRLIIQPVVP